MTILSKAINLQQICDNNQSAIYLHLNCPAKKGKEHIIKIKKCLF